MHSACEDTQFFFGSSLVRVEQTEGDVLAAFSDGVVRPYDFVIGADGLYSKSRAMDAKRMLAAPAMPRLSTANSDSDHLQVAKMLDRTATAKAPPAITPSGKFATPEQAAAEFAKHRDATIAYVSATQDALRSHGGDGPAGDKNDAYQVLLLLAAHSGRHIAQIFEVEASPNYPRGR